MWDIWERSLYIYIYMVDTRKKGEVSRNSIYPRRLLLDDDVTLDRLDRLLRK